MIVEITKGGAAGGPAIVHHFSCQEGSQVMLYSCVSQDHTGIVLVLELWDGDIIIFGEHAQTCSYGEFLEIDNSPIGIRDMSLHAIPTSKIRSIYKDDIVTVLRAQLKAALETQRITEEMSSSMRNIMKAAG